MKHVLFVDDDPNVLAGLRRLLRTFRDDWKMEFVDKADDALALMDKAPVDVVVTDMRMPGKDGAQLLTEIRARYPNVVRICLSGYSSQDTGMRAIGLAHQYLSKPCEPEVLKATVMRVCALQAHLSEPFLVRLVSRMSSIPSVPTHYQAVVEELAKEDASLARIGDIIAHDPAMTAKILQIVNSSFFGLARRVTDPRDAAKMLGLSTVDALVLTAGVFSQLEGSQLRGFPVDQLMRHSWSVGAYAKMIASMETKDKSVQSDAFVGGLLHDVGKLVLAVNFPDEYAAILQGQEGSGVSISACEFETFGASHADVGAHLMGLWGLPSPVVEAISFHHQPSKGVAAGFSPLAAVHAADAIVRHKANGETGNLDVDYSFLWKIGMFDHLAGWRAADPAEVLQEPAHA